MSTLWTIEPLQFNVFVLCSLCSSIGNYSLVGTFILAGVSLEHVVGIMILLCRSLERSVFRCECVRLVKRLNGSSGLFLFKYDLHLRRKGVHFLFFEEKR